MRWLRGIRAWFDLSDLGQPYATPLAVLRRSVVEEAEDVVSSARLAPDPGRVLRVAVGFRPRSSGLFHYPDNRGAARRASAAFVRVRR